MIRHRRRIRTRQFFATHPTEQHRELDPLIIDKQKPRVSSRHYTRNVIVRHAANELSVLLVQSHRPPIRRIINAFEIRTRRSRFSRLDPRTPGRIVRRVFLAQRTTAERTHQHNRETKKREDFHIAEHLTPHPLSRKEHSAKSGITINRIVDLPKARYLAPTMQAC